MQTIPQLFDERIHNMEIYVQKQIYNNLKLLSKLPMEQNPTGEFSNYVADSPDDVKGELITTGDGLDFNEIDFGKPSMYRGAIIPKGYMFKANTRLEQIGKGEARLQVWLNKSTANLANFYEKTYLDALKAGAGATPASSLKDITDASATGMDVMENELRIIDAMESKNGNDTGFTPDTAFVNRADKLTIDILLNRSDLKDESNFTYIATNNVPTGKILAMDFKSPTAVIQKYADPNYSIISALENDSENNIMYGTDGTSLPQSFVNLKEVEPNEPQRKYYYMWVESGLQILEGNGIEYATLY